MPQEDRTARRHERWGEFRFSVVGALLAAPPELGELKGQLEALSARRWRHPITGQWVRFSVPTIERWYYRARNERQDPVGALRRRIRNDSGRQPSVTEPIRKALHAQYKQHRTWSYQLHYDNLAVLVSENPSWGPTPSYQTVLRFMKRHGLLKRPRRGARHRPGVAVAEERFENREVRSYESQYVNALWHLDFHHGSLRVLLPSGQWAYPLLLAVLDDHSRVVCHAQWYLAETAENLVHGLCQAFQKYQLPRALMTDNGAAMVAAETQQGLGRLGILHEPTLPYSPYQNAKQEVFWSPVEGRLLAMLEGDRELTLAKLNEATLAWSEMEHNRQIHCELAARPIDRFVKGRDVSRPCPCTQDLRLAFTQELSRSQRLSDGTISVDATRLEIPSAYGHLKRLWIRRASWDLSHVYLCDARSGSLLCRIYPQDKTKNADGRRRPRELPALPQATFADAPCESPLMRKLLAEYAATGLPPAYIPKDETIDTEQPR